MHKEFEKVVYDAVINEIFLAKNQGEKYLFICADWAKQSLDLGTWMTERTVSKLARNGFVVMKVSRDMYLIDFYAEELIDNGQIYDK